MTTNTGTTSTVAKSAPSRIVIRVRGLPKDRTVARTILCKVIDAQLRNDIKYQVAVFPSCEQNNASDALVDFEILPDFLLSLKINPLGSWQVETDEGEDLTFDRHFLGFTQLYESTEPVQADIIAITGLDGHGYGSWQGRGNLRRMWLRHFLPKDLPSCRTMIYGYNAKLNRNNVASAEDYVKEFMENLKRVRCNEASKRPIIFIAHSFGGLIVARSIIKATQLKNDAMSNLVLGVLFFAVPHRGIDVEDMIRITAANEYPRTGLLQHIQVNSEPLKVQLQDFVNVLDTIKVVSFYETEQSRRLVRDTTGTWTRSGEYFTSLESSNAILQLPSNMETQIPIHSDHSNIVKFDSTSDAGYQNAVSHLKDLIVENNLAKVPKRPRNSRSREGQDEKTRYMIPLLPNLRFTGRESKLIELERRFFIDRDSREIAIYGLGGMGKTQVALSFCYATEENHPEYSIFWLSALSKAQFRADCSKLATKCSLAVYVTDDSIELMKNFLSSELAGNWLLVIDNADETNALRGDDCWLIESLPKSLTGLTLFTTRSKEIAIDLAQESILELRQMDVPDAQSLLQKFLKSYAQAQDQEHIDELLQELEYLPLAIVQASAYILKKTITISKYLTMMRKTDDSIIKMLSHEFQDGQTRSSVAVTWLVSFHQIEKDEPHAADLLYFIALIDNKAIPLSILPDVGDEGDLISAIGTLVGYSFLTQHSNAEIYDMHRLVHRAAKFHLEKKQDSIREYKVWTVEHLVNIFPYDPWIERTPFREHLTHAIRIVQDEAILNTRRGAEMCHKLGRCLGREGRYQEAITYISECVALHERISDEDDFDRLHAQATLADLYRMIGGVNDAIKLFEKIIATPSKWLADHTIMLDIQRLLARAYTQNDRSEEAIILLERAVRAGPEVLAEDDYSWLNCRSELAHAYLKVGRKKEAISLFEEVVEIEASSSTEDDPYFLNNQHKLAQAYHQTGKIREAIKLYENLIEISKRQLSEEHPNLLVAQSNLAQSYESNGQIDEAISLMRHVASVYKISTAIEHPKRMDAERVLAVMLSTAGQSEESILLMRHVVKVGQKSLPVTDHVRLSFEHDLAAILFDNKQLEEAMSLMQLVVESRQISLPTTNIERLISEEWLSEMLWVAQRREEAIALRRHVVGMCQETLTTIDPQRLRNEDWLAGMLWETGHSQEAIELRQQIVKACQGSLVTTDPFRLHNEDWLAFMVGELANLPAGPPSIEVAPDSITPLVASPGVE